MRKIDDAPRASIQVIKSPNLERHCNLIGHGFFTRHGGVSINNFSSLNVALNVGDNAMHVMQNRSFIKEHIGGINSIIFTKQCHGNNFLEVTAKNLSESVLYSSINDDSYEHANKLTMIDVSIFHADAIVTNLPRVPIGVMSADCVPILLFAQDIGYIAAIHSGWKSSIARISQKILRFLFKKGAMAKNIIAAIGPSIWQKYYEVDQDFYNSVSAASSDTVAYFNKKMERLFFDNKKYVFDMIKSCGVYDIAKINIDTFTDTRFFSYRRSNNNAAHNYTGRCASYIELL